MPMGGSCSARPTATSLRWGRRTRTRRSDRSTTRGTWTWCRAARAAAARRRSRRGRAGGGAGATPAGAGGRPRRRPGGGGQKPPYGLISRYGLIAFASSLDTVGTLTRSVRDAALLLSAIAGKDPMDATSLDEPRRDYTEGLDGAISGLRVGVVKEAFGEGVE